MGRSPCCGKEAGLKKGAWTSSEDKILTDYIKSHGEGRWRSLPQRAGLKRCGKSCRLRWMNYLRPDIKRGNISEEEEDLIMRLHRLLGNRWSLIAGRLPGRTDNEIKNYWNTKKYQHYSTKCNNSTTTNNNKKKNKKKPSSSSSSTTISQLQEATIPNNASSDMNLIAAENKNNVIRTKATRCTKVILPPQLQTSQPPGIMTMITTTPELEHYPSSSGNAAYLGAVTPPPRPPALIWEDFEADNNYFNDFIDDFLNNEFVLDFIEGHDDNTTAATVKNED